MNIGKKLRRTREKKKITLKQAYERTRIYPDVLEALEQEEYEKILNPTYIKSFLKEYASYLGLDVNKILDEYDKRLKPQKAEYHSTEPPPQKIQIFEVIKKWLLKNARLAFKWAAILVLAIVVFRGVFKIAQNIKQRQIVKQAKVAQLKAQTATEANKSKMVLKRPQAKASALKAVVIPKGERLILAIDATDDVWLRLKVDGNIIFENILKKDTSEFWKAEKDFTIWTGKAEALQLTLNGNYIGTAGKGIVKNLIIDRKGMRKE